MMNSVGVRWRKYVSRFNTFLLAINITDDSRKRAMLLHFGGFNLQDIFDSPENTGRHIRTVNTDLHVLFRTKNERQF